MGGKIGYLYTCSVYIPSNIKVVPLKEFLRLMLIYFLSLVLFLNLENNLGKLKYGTLRKN